MTTREHNKADVASLNLDVMELDNKVRDLELASAGHDKQIAEIAGLLSRSADTIIGILDVIKNIQERESERFDKLLTSDS